ARIGRNGKLFYTRIPGFGFGLYAQYIVRFFVLRSPLFPGFIENNGGLRFTRQGVQAILACFQGFAIYLNVFVDFKGGGFVSSGTPNRTKRYQADQLASVKRRTAVVYRDVCSRF